METATQQRHLSFYYPQATSKQPKMDCVCVYDNEVEGSLWCCKVCKQQQHQCVQAAGHLTELCPVCDKELQNVIVRLQDIVKCDKQVCVIPWHRRHHQFVNEPFKYISNIINRQLLCNAEQVLRLEVQGEIQDRISNQLLKRYNNPKIYIEHMMICLTKEASALLLSWLYCKQYDIIYQECWKTERTSPRGHITTAIVPDCMSLAACVNCLGYIIIYWLIL
ncbi:hypothetical protein DPMN_131687 [Dreissena polymorpha]|uniref:Uncharacterized protein n=1 Tax=Dreissena polymorpha TaxID=45954 RepID=A0A9D4FUS5_DREPO|nr:hypothetical protein DPMN_131687 [Dreissena polymorpha]